MRKNLKKKKQSKKIVKVKPAPRPVHYTASYFMDPEHPISVNLIGCGGTGSQMLTQLGRIHASLRALGHPGFALTAYDPDTVTEANMGRQLFSRSDIGEPKANILVTRLNRFFSLNWKAVPTIYGEQAVKNSPANITITCTDNVLSRRVVSRLHNDTKSMPNAWTYRTPAYWLDLGNSKTTGQIVLGTFREIKQPSKTPHAVATLPTIFGLFPDLQKHEDKDTTPSCSLAEALDRQDLFINSILAQYGAQILWRMFRELKIGYHGAFINLDTLNTNPIMIKSNA
jgi:PRTRC genetic system ThiF family protein